MKASNWDKSYIGVLIAKVYCYEGSGDCAHACPFFHLDNCPLSTTRVTEVDYNLAKLALKNIKKDMEEEKQELTMLISSISKCRI